MGKSGIGKSTLAKVISGIYSPSNGSILIDNIDIMEISEEKRAKFITYVPQDPLIIKGTLFENITLGTDPSEISEEKMRRAVEAANLSRVIEESPLGLSSFIEENGDNLSTGQKQRIGIARAIVKNSPIIILDEPLSNQDEFSSKIILQGLMLLKQTVLFIVHNKNYADKADHIIFFKDDDIYFE